MVSLDLVLLYEEEITMGTGMQEINKYRLQAKKQHEERERAEVSRSKSRLQFAMRTGVRNGLFAAICTALGWYLVQSFGWIWSPGCSLESLIRPSRIASMVVVVFGIIIVMSVLQWFRWAKLRK